MTRSKYFFYPKDGKDTTNRKPPQEARALPAEHSEELTPPRFSVRAGSVLRPPLEASAERMAGTILTDLSSMQSRTVSKKIALPFSALLSILSELCESSTTTVVANQLHADAYVATCTHNLLFAIGTVVHHAAANDIPLTLSFSEDKKGPVIRIYSEQTSLTPEEAAEHFGLSPYRLSVLKRIASASDFSIEPIPADRSELCFRIPNYTPDTYRVFAIGDPTLRAAFMQPLVYFVF